MIDESQFGKGAIQTPPEIAATKYRLAAVGPRVIDWSTQHDVEQGFTLFQRDQRSSLSCTAQATGYYTEALNKIENGRDERYSARFIYSQVYVPGGGAFIWKAMSIPLKLGTASSASVPDGNSTEAEMTDRSLNGTALIEARADKYAQITNFRDIDQLAGIIDDYHGFVTGYNGYDGMSLSDGTLMLPTKPIEWGHCVYVCGYEIHKGVKCLKFKNSWTAQWGSNGYGYFTEDFVKYGPLFDAYVYADIQDIDPTSMKLQLASDPKIPSKVFALVEATKTKMWIPNPSALTNGQTAGFWGGFDSVVTKDLSAYKEGVIQISLAE